MLTLTVLRSNGVACGFSVRGHANQGEYGHDLLCAAVSAIVQTTALGITDVLELDAAVEFHDGEGDCVLTGDADPDKADKAAVLFDTMEKGLRSLAAAYPKTLKFRYREV